MNDHLEITEENKYVRKIAKIYGAWALKFKHEGRKGAPDRIVFFHQDVKPLFIEFKKPDGKGELSPHQEDFHKQLNYLNYEVFVCITCEEAMKVTREYLNI